MKFFWGNVLTNCTELAGSEKERAICCTILTRKLVGMVERQNIQNG